MVDKYRKGINSNDYNIVIDGVDFIMEEPTPNTMFNYREVSRHDIIGGTQQVIRTTYMVRDFSFKLHLMIDPLYPDVYHSMFKSWMSKPTEVISNYMGGKFLAEIVVKAVPSGRYLEVDVDVKEIPDTESNIPNDTIVSVADKSVTVTSTSNKDKLKKEIDEVTLEITKLKKKSKTKKNKDKIATLKEKLKTLKEQYSKLKQDSKGNKLKTSSNKKNTGKSKKQRSNNITTTK